MVKVGDAVTARIAGAYRGATVTEVHKDRSITVLCHCPRGTEFTIPNGKYQDSRAWNNPKTRNKALDY